MSEQTLTVVTLEGMVLKLVDSIPNTFHFGVGIESQSIFVSLYGDEHAQERCEIAFLDSEDEYDEVVSEPDRLHIYDIPYIEYAILEYLQSQKIPFILSFDGENHEITGNGFNAHAKTRAIALAFVAIQISESSRV